jgi:hypothetical protein
LLNQEQPGTSYSDVFDGCILDLDFADTASLRKNASVSYDTRGREVGTPSNISYINERTHRGAIDFTNGRSSNQRITITRKNGNPWISNTGTLLFWFYADDFVSSDVYEEIIGNDTYGGSDGWRFYRYEKTQLRFWESNNQISDSTPGRIILDEWHCYAMTRDGSTVKIYRDGVQIGSNYTAGIANWSGATIYVGGSYATGANGDMGVVRVYDRPLSAGELLQYYNFTKWRFTN